MHQQNGHASSSHSHIGSSLCYLRITVILALPLTTHLHPPIYLQNPTAAQVPLPDSLRLPTLPPVRRPRLTFMSWRGVGSCQTTQIDTPSSMLMLAYGRVTSRGVPSRLGHAHDPWRAMIASLQPVKALALSVHLHVSLAFQLCQMSRCI